MTQPNPMMTHKQPHLRVDPTRPIATQNVRFTDVRSISQFCDRKRKHAYAAGYLKCFFCIDLWTRPNPTHRWTHV